MRAATRATAARVAATRARARRARATTIRDDDSTRRRRRASRAEARRRDDDDGASGARETAPRASASARASAMDAIWARAHPKYLQSDALDDAFCDEIERADDVAPVSYTHLTLPTILLV